MIHNIPSAIPVRVRQSGGPADSSWSEVRLWVGSVDKSSNISCNDGVIALVVDRQGYVGKFCIEDIKVEGIAE